MAACGETSANIEKNPELLFMSLIFCPATEFNPPAAQQSCHDRRVVKERKLPSGAGGWTFTRQNRMLEKVLAVDSTYRTTVGSSLEEELKPNLAGLS